MGPSGSGKSTLMHILAGLDRPTERHGRDRRHDITTLKDTDLTKLRRRHIGFVFQFFNLLPMLTAEENITLPLAIAGTKPERAWLEELLAATGLDDRRSHRPAELSGGQQQRVAVARALVSRPTVLFADEPTGNLDSQTSAEILGLLRGAVDTYGQTTVMVTHDPKAATIADRVLFLADGLIVKRARPLVAERDPRRSREVRTMRRVALRGLLARKLRSAAHGDRDRARRRDGERHARPDGHDREGLRHDLLESYANTDAVVSGTKLVEWSQTGRRPSRRMSSATSRALPEVEAAAGTIVDKSGDANQARSSTARARRSRAAPRRSASASNPEDERFNPLQLVEGDWPSGRTRS